MQIQIIMTQEENEQIVDHILTGNRTRDQIKELVSQLNRERRDAQTAWTAIQRRYQLDKPEERAKMVFPNIDGIEIKNGAIFFDMPEIPIEEKCGQE